MIETPEHRGIAFKEIADSHKSTQMEKEESETLQLQTIITRIFMVLY